MTGSCSSGGSSGRVCFGSVVLWAFGRPFCVGAFCVGAFCVGALAFGGLWIGALVFGSRRRLWDTGGSRRFAGGASSGGCRSDPEFVFYASC